MLCSDAVLLIVGSHCPVAVMQIANFCYWCYWPCTPAHVIALLHPHSPLLYCKKSAKQPSAVEKANNQLRLLGTVFSRARDVYESSSCTGHNRALELTKHITGSDWWLVLPPSPAHLDYRHNLCLLFLHACTYLYVPVLTCIYSLRWSRHCCRASSRQSWTLCSLSGRRATLSSLNVLPSSTASPSSSRR